MIIDLILDRKNGIEYNAEEFYRDVLEYENIFELSHDITLSMDYGNNKEVQNALCKYIDDQNYNPDLKQYICSVDWITDNSEHDYTNTEHCKKCFKCAAIARQEINNLNLEKRIDEKTKEIFSEDFMQQIRCKLSANIGKLIDEL